jgi:hypothetical protein
MQILASPDTTGAKSLSKSEAGSALTRLDSQELKQQFSSTLKGVSTMFEEYNAQQQSLKIKEITLKFEITTKGEVRLIAAAGVEAKGAIEVKFSYS